MSENNYGALMMKSALSASVDIDSIITPGIYPVPSGNPSSPDTNGGVLTIHPGVVRQRIFESHSILFSISTYNSATGKWGDWNYSLTRQELSSPEGTPLVSPKKVKAGNNTTLADVLGRMRALADYGYIPTIYGYNPAGDSLAYDEMAIQADSQSQILFNGNFSGAKKFRGVRRNATPFSIRGGRAMYEDEKAFSPQVVGVDSVEALSLYNLHDGVANYADATLPSLEPWEVVATATYTESSVTVSTANHSDLLANARVGDIIKTNHSVKAWGMIKDINIYTGVITVNGWASFGNLVIPANDGSGFAINAIDKVWAFNYNTIVDANAYGKYAVIGEIGAQIKKEGLGYVNGLDCVLLDGSVANGTAAYLARSGADGLGWLYGFNAQGNQFNFYSTSGNLQPYAGFMENSNAVVGQKFTNKNDYSQLWTTSSDLTQTGLEFSPTIVGPIGQIYRRPERILIINESAALHPLYPTVYIKNADATLTLPDTSILPVSGYVYKLIFFSSGTYIIKAFNSQTTINGLSTFTITLSMKTTERKIIEVQFDGTYWQLY